MIISFLTLSLFSFHFSPYLQIEKSFLKYNCEDTLNYGTGFAVVLQQGDIFVLGASFEEKHLWTDLSFGLPWYDDIKFLPCLNINTGAKWKNFTGYAGYLLSMRNEDPTKGFNSIYTGVGSFYRINNFNIDVDFQLQKEYISSTTPWFRDKDTSYINTVFTSKIGYVFKNYNPFMFLSFNKRSFSEPLSFRAGLGILLTSSPVTRGKNVGKTIRCYHYYEGIQPLKPNIYLYPVEPGSVTVMLEPDGRLTVSDPPYQNGWNVYAFPDGMIQNTPGYLFYEAKINKMRVTDKGWYITKDEVTSFFFSILTSYGFNKRETNDFVSYWKNNLPDSPYYVIYPAVNKEIDKVCPLTVYPSPDIVLRVWFVVESVKTPVSLDAPAIPSFKRNGFVVTEWGVILGDSKE